MVSTRAERKDDVVAETIGFAVRPCLLGHVLVASSAVGVCAVLLGDEPHVLIDDLRARFATATLTVAGNDDVIAAVTAAVDGTASAAMVSLDLRGTAVQQRVWQALCAIPVGQTITYTQLAAAVGAPTSSRAVARACGANAVAVVVPCHRVVRADGGLSGYRWGVERKRVLLGREAAMRDDRLC